MPQFVRPRTMPPAARIWVPVVLAILGVGKVVSMSVRGGGAVLLLLLLLGGGSDGGAERGSLSDFGQVAGTDLLS